MDAEERRVEYYETADGKQPFRDWFNSLRDRRAQAKIQIRIDRVSLGNLGYCRSVGQGVMKLKVDYGSGYRVYFGQFGDKLVILLSGGDKSSQNRDIRASHEYWRDYRRRHGQDEA